MWVVVEQVDGLLHFLNTNRTDISALVVITVQNVPPNLQMLFQHKDSSLGHNDLTIFSWYWYCNSLCVDLGS